MLLLQSPRHSPLLIFLITLASCCDTLEETALNSSLVYLLFFAFVITSRVFPSFPPRGSRNLESRIFLQHFRPVLEFVCANRQGSWVVQWVCCTLTHLFSALVTSTSANFESLRRALGTALEWPDAKQRAHQVREWGIEVRPAQLYNFGLQNYICRLTGDLAIACYLAQS